MSTIVFLGAGVAGGKCSVTLRSSSVYTIKLSGVTLGVAYDWADTWQQPRALADWSETRVVCIIIRAIAQYAVL